MSFTLMVLSILKKEITHLYTAPSREPHCQIHRYLVLTMTQGRIRWKILMPKLRYKRRIVGRAVEETFAVIYANKNKLNKYVCCFNGIIYVKKQDGVKVFHPRIWRNVVYTDDCRFILSYRKNTIKSFCFSDKE